MGTFRKARFNDNSTSEHHDKISIILFALLGGHHYDFSRSGIFKQGSPTSPLNKFITITIFSNGQTTNHIPKAAVWFMWCICEHFYNITIYYCRTQHNIAYGPNIRLYFRKMHTDAWYVQSQFFFLLSGVTSPQVLVSIQPPLVLVSSLTY